MSDFSGQAYYEAQHKQEWEAEYKGYKRRSEYSSKLQKMEDEWDRNRTPSLAVESAVLAFETHIQTRKVDAFMNLALQKNQPVVSLAEKFGFTEKQLDLIKRTVAKQATDDELELFFYRCKELDLNPLMPGEVFFVKYGSNPGTIITGLDGFRKRAHRTGQLSGIKRGVIRNEKGECTGGWADIYHKEWTEPAHEEASVREYTTGKGNWLKMPETMIKKVAEVAALRMAFPNQLGGIYIREEMREIKDVESEVEQELKPGFDQLTHLYTLAKEAGVQTKIDVNKISVERCGYPTLELPLSEYVKLCNYFSQLKAVAASPEVGQVQVEG